jgi:AAA15 family ATPase/GTPase
MLKQITFSNFRCFESHTVPLQGVTIAVGKNNAGKSTFVEGLRVIALVCNRFRNLSFKSPPKWLNLSARYNGVSPSMENLGIDFPALCYGYG